MSLFLHPRLPLLLVALAAAAHSLRNYTVEDSDAQIAYSGAWLKVDDVPADDWDSGDSHHLSQDTAASASFSFSGVALYYAAPRWPYAVSTSLSLDGGASVLIDLQDHGKTDDNDGSPTTRSSVVWGSGTLASGNHTVKISLGSGQYAIVDALIYTAEDASSSSSSSSSQSSSSPTSTSTSPPNPSTSLQSSGPSSKIPIAVYPAAAIGALLLIGALIFYICRRRRLRRRNAGPKAIPFPGDEPPSFPPMGAPLPNSVTYSGVQYAAIPAVIDENPFGAGQLKPLVHPLPAGASMKPTLSSYPPTIAQARPLTVVNLSYDSNTGNSSSTSSLIVGGSGGSGYQRQQGSGYERLYNDQKDHLRMGGSFGDAAIPDVTPPAYSER